ncbi:MAG TPA: nucleotidyltransferase family protein [Gammaproteobacteria bacterium]|nr:nucleotidyltransferase family protein [Gammaproteobacteria bacterium]
MNAMILAAGRGERMRPLTDRTPKPLLRVGGRALIDWHLAALAAAGVERVVVNVAWLGSSIAQYLDDPAHRRGLDVRISDEGQAALETGGGIRRALPLLGDEPFWVVNGDVWSDFDYRVLPNAPRGLAHLVLVDNPDHHPEGDFALAGDRIQEPPRDGRRLTFAGIGCYAPELFANSADGVFRLAPLLRQAATQGGVDGTHHTGRWCDVGTPARLDALDRLLGGDAVTHE